MDGGHVITHLMNLSIWQNSKITQLSMYAAITPLIHDATTANVVSHNRNLYQHTSHQLVVNVVLAIIY